MSHVPSTTANSEGEDHRASAVAANQRVWALLEQATRTASEDAELIDAAHASLYHWRQVGTNVHRQRGEWLLSHVYAVLGRAEPALVHARRCATVTESEPQGLADFDLAYAHEALARALALAGDPTAARAHYAQAETAGNAIDNAEDRFLFFGDFNAGPWYGLR